MCTPLQKAQRRTRYVVTLFAASIVAGILAIEAFERKDIAIFCWLISMPVFVVGIIVTEKEWRAFLAEKLAEGMTKEEAREAWNKKYHGYL